MAQDRHVGPSGLQRLVPGPHGQRARHPTPLGPAPTGTGSERRYGEDGRTPARAPARIGPSPQADQPGQRPAPPLTPDRRSPGCHGTPGQPDRRPS